jgi:hypothetical protein
MARERTQRTPLSLDDIAHIVERHCGMSNHDAHALLEEVLEQVGSLIRAKRSRQAQTSPHVPPVREVPIPSTLPYTEEWDPDFDPRKGLLLLRPDGTPPDKTPVNEAPTP